ncbi:MAG: hypothetical protein OHK0053_38340 [Microscillaceae bacterium]
MQKEPLKFPPSPQHQHWLLGNLLDFRRNHNSIPYLQEKQKELGDIHWIRLPFGHRLFAITRPDYIKHVLQDNNKNYTKGIAYNALRPLLGNGLLTSEGDFWRKQRRLAQPAFHKNRLESLTQTMIKATLELIEGWEAQYTEDQSINVSREMNHLALLVVSSALFKSDVKAEMDLIGEHLGILIEGAAHDIQYPLLAKIRLPTSYNRRRRKALEALHQLITGIIEKRRKDPQSYDDLLDMLLKARDEETGEGMDDQQLKDEVMTIFMAGHETTANALTYAWLLLARHPEVAQKMHAEIAEKLGSEAPQLENIRELRYTRMVIDETLRLYPPAWTVSRRSIEADQIDGYYIPPRTNILMSTYVVHRLPELWEQPDVFWPERFETQKVKNLPRYAYFPFGGGPRLCIGDQFALLEMQVALALISQRYSLQEQRPNHLQPLPLITLRPKDHVFLQLEKRKVNVH